MMRGFTQMSGLDENGSFELLEYVDTRHTDLMMLLSFTDFFRVYRNSYCFKALTYIQSFLYPYFSANLKIHLETYMPMYNFTSVTHKKEGKDYMVDVNYAYKDNVEVETTQLVLITNI